MVIVMSRFIHQKAMGEILIEDLEVWYRVGVPEAERSEPQRLSLTLELSTDFSDAAATDDVDDTIDYFQVVQRLRSFGDARSWCLIEKLVSDIADAILAEFKPDSVVVEVRKFIIPETRSVGVRVAKRAPEAME